MPSKKLTLNSFSRATRLNKRQLRRKKLPEQLDLEKYIDKLVRETQARREEAEKLKASFKKFFVPYPRQMLESVCVGTSGVKSFSLLEEEKAELEAKSE